jgi:recombination protein RecR
MSLHRKIEQLARFLKRLPGVGSRQAERFAYALLEEEDILIQNFIHDLEIARGIKHICPLSKQIFFEESSEVISPVLRDTTRNHDTILILEKQSDFDHIEKLGVYQGDYYVLGKLGIPLLDTEIIEHPHVGEMFSAWERRKEFGLPFPSEIIFGLSPMPDHDRIVEVLEPLIKEHFPGIQVTQVARGLSTGLSLEYSDSSTLKASLDGRK